MRRNSDLGKLDRFLFGFDMQKLMINENLNTVTKLETALVVAEVFVSALPSETPYHKFEQR